MVARKAVSSVCDARTAYFVMRIVLRIEHLLDALVARRWMGWQRATDDLIDDVNVMLMVDNAQSKPFNRCVHRACLPACTPDKSVDLQNGQQHDI